MIVDAYVVVGGVVTYIIILRVSTMRCDTGVGVVVMFLVVYDVVYVDVTFVLHYVCVVVDICIVCVL